MGDRYNPRRRMTANVLLVIAFPLIEGVAKRGDDGRVASS
jgi:hypothetical protein